MADCSDKELNDCLKEADSTSLLFCCSIDPRERHLVCKLERCELEDKYLRLLEEMQSLKKLSNCQEDKIKRLATKLMRFGANPRIDCALTCSDNRDKLLILEAENTKLKNKVSLLRNQLMNGKIFAKPSSRQGRRSSLPLGSTSGPTSCRSETSRLKLGSSCQCMSDRPTTATDDNDLQNYCLKIKEMESEKKALESRVNELELELASMASGSRREKVAENVEYIRVWRQMKRQNEKLTCAQAANEMLSSQIIQLKRNLEDCCKCKEKISETLAAERKLHADMDESVARAKDSDVYLREKDDRISDLMKEIDILQQHNRELLELSAKFAKVEQDNKETRRKNAELTADYQKLGDQLNNEKASMAALQAANDQLLAKLHDLQKNIDVMTIQLMEQNEKYNTAATRAKRSSKRSNGSTVSTVNSEAGGGSSRKSPSKSESKESKESRSSRDSRESKDASSSATTSSSCNKSQKINSEHYEKGVQTSDMLQLINEATQTEANGSNGSAAAAKSPPGENAAIGNKAGPVPLARSNGRSSLSREGMLKLLEQVQISTPLDAQNASIMRRVDPAVAVNLYAMTRQPSNLETFLFGDASL